jgi:hypothetical protein
MKLALSAFAALAIAAIALVTVDGSDAPPAEAGITKLLYDKQLTGRGGGAANQNSSLTLGCDQASHTLLSGGFFGLDPGSKPISSEVMSASGNYKFTWRNDSTRDIVGVRVVCFPHDIATDLAADGGTAQPGLVGGGQLGCDDNFVLGMGGFLDLNPTTRLIATFPTTNTTWKITIRPQTLDNHGLQVYCFAEPQTLVTRVTRVGPGGGTANGLGQLSVSCSDGHGISGIGVGQLDAGTQLQAIRPVDVDTGRVTWQNDGTIDSVRVYGTCVRFLP